MAFDPTSERDDWPASEQSPRFLGTEPPQWRGEARGRLEDGWVSYRFGKPGAPEITIDSIAMLSSRGYPGGGETRLRFSGDAHGDYVFDLIRHDGWLDEEAGLRAFEDRAGLNVVENGERITTLSCTNWHGGNGGKVLTGKLTTEQEEEFAEFD